MGLRTFLSYAGENRADVAVFRKHLSAAEHGGQIKVWIDSEKIPTGSDFDQKLTEALKRTDLLIAVLSKAYFSSTWCTKELQTARDRGIPVIPVLLEPCAYEFSGLGHLSATPDKGKKAVLEHPKKDQDVIWAKKVVPDIMAAVPVLPAPAPSPTPPPPTAPEWFRVPPAVAGPAAPEGSKSPDKILDIRLTRTGQTVDVSYHIPGEIEATRRRPNVLLDGPFASVPKAATLTGLSALLHHLAQGEAALAKGPLTPKIVGQMLFQLLFGDKSDHQPVLATLFADPAGTPTSPNRGPVRCRLVTTDPDLMRLPWRLLVWNDTFLTLDQGWSVELFDPRDAQTNVELSGPPRVLLIVSDPDGALGGDQHIAGWKSLFSTLSPKFSETPHAWLRFARTQTELDRLLKHGRIQPEVVYYFGYCSSHGAQANPVLHLGMGGGGQGEVRLQEIIDSLPPSVRLLYLNGFCRNHAGLPPVCTAGAVPCVVYPTVSTHPHRAADAALQWFGAMVRHAADPVTALSLIPRNLRTTATEALSVRTAYRSWTTGETLTVDYRGNAENHLDRDDQRTKLNHHVGGLIKSPEQTMELFVAYGDEHQHMAGLGSLLFRYVETERDPVALIRYRRLLFPNKTERTGAVDALTHRLTGMFSGDTAAGAIHHVFDKVATVPGKRFVVFLDWGVHGEAETDKLTLDELEALWTWHTQVLASSLTPKEIAVVALLTFERPGPSHVRFRTALDTLRQKSGVQSTRCPITILDPLASVDEDHVTRFLSNNQWSGCGSTRAPRAAAVILRRTGGVFKKACEEIDHAETIGWDSYLADNEAPTATPVPTTQPLDGSTTI